mmetsp:Transcript_57439/g.136548  ORF Transcript_57439/g.136548 Transcript_57439/m.136548 type:complete len:135 (-) Transcript_57439:845-1249(-)
MSRFQERFHLSKSSRLQSAPMIQCYIIPLRRRHVPQAILSGTLQFTLAPNLRYMVRIFLKQEDVQLDIRLFDLRLKAIGLESCRTEAVTSRSYSTWAQPRKTAPSSAEILSRLCSQWREFSQRLVLVGLVRSPH